ncbi:MAG: hypothetical protein EOO20_21180 [Chryseobacterium sp.]|nr:MAG: hypothetical protein EOO20_21180 [Chryseobacterium sp.]
MLIALQKKWNVTCTAVDRDWYSVKFNNYPQYQKFKKYALELSKPYYVFEGDVLDIFASPDFVGSMVEIRVSRVFAIPHTLAKLTGLKKLDD